VGTSRRSVLWRGGGGGGGRGCEDTCVGGSLHVALCSATLSFTRSLRFFRGAGRSNLSRISQSSPGLGATNEGRGAVAARRVRQRSATVVRRAGHSVGAPPSLTRGFLLGTLWSLWIWRLCGSLIQKSRLTETTCWPEGTDTSVDRGKQDARRMGRQARVRATRWWGD